ncbi:MAG: MFS transporter [Planctomycetes bacterium]|nr:MFS transporter [Planctomycetota bacterium]
MESRTFEDVQHARAIDAPPNLTKADESLQSSFVTSHGTDGIDPTSDAAAARAAALISGLLFVSMIPVTMLVAPLKELIAIRHGAGDFATHAFMSINMIGAILIAPLVGARADRPAQRRRTAILALAVDAVLLAAMALAPSLAVLLTLRFFEGAAHVVAISQLMALAASWASPQKRGRAMGMAGAAMMFGTACGTRLGGPIWHSMPGWTFQIAGVISAMAAFLVLVFASEPRAAQSEAPAFPGIRATLRENRALAIPYAYALMDRLCVGVIVSTFVLYLSDIGQLEPGQRSRLLGLFLIPFAALVYPAGRLVDRVGRVWPISVASLVFGAMFATYPWFEIASLPVVMLLSGVVSAIMFAPSLALTADLAPPGGRGAAFTGFNVAGSLGFTMGPLMAGGLFAWWSANGQTIDAYRFTFAVAGAMQMACAMATLPALIRLKRSGLTR